MKKIVKKLLILFLLSAFLLSVSPSVSAYERGQPYSFDLSAWMKNEEYRSYVEMMLDYHLRTNRDVQNALEGGFTAVFMFDGCSDHMDNPRLSDLSYYRVTGVCIVIKLDDAGEPQVLYFNRNCSTIPDRPLEYGAWSLPEVGDVGPATIYDGTYQLYSVRHKGKYEALHVRTDYWDMTLDAVYMTPEGFVTSRANEINVHTRTSNHTSGVGMWSAGCPLVGDGDAWEFRRLIAMTYYTTYDSFELDNFVGTLTIDRQKLRQELYTLYRNPDAVDMVLTNSRQIQPETYLQQCSDAEMYAESEIMAASKATELMTLPCSNSTDARSRVLSSVSKGQTFTVTGSIRNYAGNLWYQVELDGESGYIFSGHAEKATLTKRIFGFLS